MNHLQPSRYKFAMAGVTQRYKTSSMVECIYTTTIIIVNN